MESSSMKRVLPIIIGFALFGLLVLIMSQIGKPTPSEVKQTAFKNQLCDAPLVMRNGV
jgi:hypothetical protein